MAPLKPSFAVRSNSSAAASGTAVGSAAKPAKRVGFLATIAARRSLTRVAIAGAVSAGNFCVDGAPCESTWMSMPASSISLMRSAPEIMQPVELLAGPAGFRADKGFFELFVPIMLFDGDDGTMRFTEHLFPPLAHDPEKWKPVFGQDHAQTRNLADTVVSNSAYPSHLGEQSINVTFS